MTHQLYQFCTSSGHIFELDKIQPDDIRIEDIANALNKICRFSGNTTMFYSVALHSIRVAWIVPPEYRLVALLHDATETYMGDIPTPVKRLVPEIEMFEHGLWQVIATKFNLPPVIPQVVKDADFAILQLECEEFTNGLDLGPYPYEVRPGTVSQMNTVQTFLRLFHENGGVV